MPKPITTMFLLLALSGVLAACDNPGNQKADTQSDANAKQEMGNDQAAPAKGDTGPAESEQAADSMGTAEATNSALMMNGDGPKAVAMLDPSKGYDVQGKVTFTKVEGGVKVHADLKNLTPGKHGFHIHAHGDCSAPDLSSAGGHYSPKPSPHGAPTDPPPEHHMGDMGNVKANDSGKVSTSRTFDFLTLSGEYSIIGQAVIVHAGADDLTSQPSGAAGPRVACGVIKAVGADGSMGG